jgi:hypothetical protein
MAILKTGAVFVLLVFACAPEPPAPLPTDPQSTAAIVAVRARLIGPNAARFRNVRRSASDTTVTCGEVAAMNAAQEYVGWRRWAVVDGRAAIQPDSLPDACR